MQSAFSSFLQALMILLFHCFLLSMSCLAFHWT